MQGLHGELRALRRGLREGLSPGVQPTPPPPPPEPGAAPSGALVTLLIIAVLGLVRLKCGGASEADLAIEQARQRNEAADKSLIQLPVKTP